MQMHAMTQWNYHQTNNEYRFPSKFVCAWPHHEVGVMSLVPREAEKARSHCMTSTNSINQWCVFVNSCFPAKTRLYWFWGPSSPKCCSSKGCCNATTSTPWSQPCWDCLLDSFPLQNSILDGKALSIPRALLQFHDSQYTCALVSIMPPEAMCMLPICHQT